MAPKAMKSWGRPANELQTDRRKITNREVEQCGKERRTTRTAEAAGRGYGSWLSARTVRQPKRTTAHEGLVALRNKIGEVDADGRPIEERLVEVLVHEALGVKNRLSAVEVIFDRLEGRARQRVGVADITAELRNKSDGELQFHLDNNRWPDEQELRLLDTANDALE